MKRLIIAVFSLASLTAGVAAKAEGDAAAGQSKSTVCTACHGADGNSVNPEWPSLAGQHENYTIDQLKAFKDGDRVNVLMSAQAIALSDQDMADLAAWYAGQTVKPTAADADLAAAGERLYRSGDADRQISACSACHGPQGRGNGPAGMPAIAGQKSTYLIAQLKAYADGSRASDSEIKTSMMQLVAANLSEEDMQALASFIGALQ